MSLSVPLLSKQELAECCARSRTWDYLACSPPSRNKRVNYTTINTSHLSALSSHVGKACRNRLFPRSALHVDLDKVSNNRNPPTTNYAHHHNLYYIQEINIKAQKIWADKTAELYASPGGDDVLGKLRSAEDGKSFTTQASLQSSFLLLYSNTISKLSAHRGLGRKGPFM
jgi:hypothetical protein